MMPTRWLPCNPRHPKNDLAGRTVCPRLKFFQIFGEVLLPKALACEYAFEEAKNRVLRKMLARADREIAEVAPQRASIESFLRMFGIRAGR